MRASEFIIENVKAYHGTFQPSLAQFHPLSHFGTLKAAEDRLAYKSKKEKIKDPGRVYEVVLDIKNPFIAKDFAGVHSPTHFVFDLKSAKLISQEELSAINKYMGTPKQAQLLIKKLRELGFDSIAYKNKYEDKGSTSYVILDPSQVISVKPVEQKEAVTEARIPDEIEDFLYDLMPDDAGVEEFGPYRVHYEGFTDDCQSSADYRANPEAVYKQVFADHIAREGGRKPIEQNFTGDEDYPILYSIFKIPRQVKENFADGKVKGKSRPGRVKRAGASCAGSVSSLRAKAKKAGGERGKMYHWCANMKSGRKKVSEISRLPKSDAGDWGGKGTLANPTGPVKTKPLPGGSKFSYAVNRPDAENIEIMIFDGKKLAAEMDLYYTQDYMKTWKVDTVVTEPEYRGQGLGKALYGIALSILKLTIEAGESQTRNGQAMWLMLNSIPGVEVQGYHMVPTKDYKAQKGDKIVDQNANWTRYTFPVTPGKQSMRSGRPGTGLYTTQATLIARWHGQTLKEETAREVLDYVKSIHRNGDFNLDYAIMAYPEWEQRNVPTKKLLLPNDSNMDLDPYLRVNAIDWDHVNSLTEKEILHNPVIVDPQGWVIDGNHRVRAALRLGLKSIPAFVVTYPAIGFR